MAQTATINFVMFLLRQILFLIVTQVAADQSILETIVVNENGEEISLKWVETEPFLANDNLPIWLTTALPGYVEQDLDTMKEIGKFKTYHDLEKTSAIIFIEKWDCIYGIIDIRYSIVCLPLNQLDGYKHKIGESDNVIILSQDELLKHEKFIEKPAGGNVPELDDDANEFKMLIKTLVDDLSATSHHRDCTVHRTANQSPKSLAGPPPNKRQRKNYNYVDQVIIVYPEVLIFISNEIVRTAQYLVTIVLRYLIQFNAVAMLFAKLATHDIKIHINIAGLVIEKNHDQFPSTLLFENGRPSGSAVLNSITEYIKQVRMISKTGDNQEVVFTDDSFDMFLLSTTNEWQELDVNPGGISNSVFDLTDNRRTPLPINAKKFLGSIVNSNNVMQHYVNAAREIAHLMTVEDDPQSNFDWCFNEDQCHAIMQTNRHCLNCLKWSLKSVKSLKKYLSTNPNRCFLRNLPRSLHPYGHPLKSLVPADQCLCHGYWPDSEITYLRGNIDVCKRIIRCISRDNGRRLRKTPLPLDGTPCGNSDSEKVCWNQQCISTRLGIDQTYTIAT